MRQGKPDASAWRLMFLLVTRLEPGNEGIFLPITDASEFAPVDELNVRVDEFRKAGP